MVLTFSGFLLSVKNELSIRLTSFIELQHQNIFIKDKNKNAPEITYTHKFQETFKIQTTQQCHNCLKENKTIKTLSYKTNTKKLMVKTAMFIDLIKYLSQLRQKQCKLTYKYSRCF